jgi:hypothetical protein
MNDLQKLLKNYPDKPWKWEDLNRNPNITMEFVLQNPDKPWKWDG